MRAICGHARREITSTTVQTLLFSPEQGQLSNHQSAEDQGQRKEDVTKTGQNNVEPTAVETSEGPERHSDNQDAQHRQDAHRKRGLCSVYDFRA